MISGDGWAGELTFSMSSPTSLEHESVLRPLFQYSFHTGFLDVGVQDLDHQAIDVLYKKDVLVSM